MLWKIVHSVSGEEDEHFEELFFLNFGLYNKQNVMVRGGWWV